MRANDVILVYLPLVKDNTANQKPGKQLHILRYATGSTYRIHKARSEHGVEAF